jgi:dihydroorotase
MCHIGGVRTPELMSQILDLLRPGDVLTHCYSARPNIGGKFTNIVQEGKLFPAGTEREEARRGVRHRARRRQLRLHDRRGGDRAGCGPPDTISSDIHVFSGNTPGMPYLTWVMSKFLNMGFTLEQVVTMATMNPAKVINRIPKLGTLQVGAPADATVVELVQGPIEFVDTRNNKRQGNVHLRPTNTVLAGTAYGRPYQAPFSVR